jgi:hypothetical protein
MRKAGRVALLDFAIAASLAIAPLLFAVLLWIGLAAPSREPTLGGDSHVSVREVAALKTVEHAIVRRDAVRSPLPDAVALLAYVPECAAPWSASRRERAIDRVRQWLGKPAADLRAPAARIAFDIGEIDAALARMSAAANRRVSDAVGFDAVRWGAAARSALATPIEAARYPGRTFDLRCADLVSAIAMLARGHGRMLDALAWRGTEVDRTLARWRPDQYVEVSARQLERANPWAGLAGCVYLAGGRDAASVFVRTARTANGRACMQPSLFDPAPGDNGNAPPKAISGEPGPDVAADDPRWSVPPSLQALLQPLETLQRTSGALYRTFADASRAASGDSAANRVTLDGAPVDIGYSVDLTVDPALQALAQRTAACYTGRQDVCRALGIRRAEDGDAAIGHRLLEHAMVRMAAVAIVDVASGRIDALAGALSPCTRNEYDGPGRDAGCDARLPYPVRYRPDALLNPAVFHDAMPGSVIKPVMASAFLANATVGARWLAAERNAMRGGAPPAAGSLRGQLAHSNSARFLDRMFCADQGFRPCERPWEIQALSSAFGWNAGCAQPSERCGRRDLLFGRVAGEPLDAPAEWIPFGRLLVEPVGGRMDAPFALRAAVPLDTARIERCAAGHDGIRGDGDDWEKCSGGVVVDVVAEGWGQGHARASALGVAGMMASLAAAANGDREVHRPHLVQSIRGVGSQDALDAALARWLASGTEPNRVPREAAEVILSGLSYSHRQGTARRACEQVLDARACRTIDWIAGKTGTPTFPNDDRSLDDIAKLCAPGVARSPRDELACTSLRPYKWYVAAYRSDPAQAAWTKAIAVLTERNWLADSGRVHGAGDHGPNPAAEIAFQIAARHAGVLDGAAR